MPSDTTKPGTPQPVLRKPDAKDGPAIWELVKTCKPLDENSLYCNLIQAEHFRDTCVLAELEDRAVGWISGHIIPNEDAFFVWQVAVSPQARGMGLGRRMLTHLMDRETCRGVQSLKTTITPDNQASWALFRSFAKKRGGSLSQQPHFTRDTHFAGRHETEHMVTIALPRQARLLQVA